MASRDSKATAVQGDRSARLKGRPNPMTSTSPIVDDLNAVQLEALFNDNLRESNRLCDSEEVKSREVALAKMLNYCIRMLHSHGWVGSGFGHVICVS